MRALILFVCMAVTAAAADLNDPGFVAELEAPAPGGGGGVNLNSGLLAYWKLDNSAAWEDSVASFDLTAVGSITNATGLIGNCAGLGVIANDEYLETDDGNGYFGTRADGLAASADQAFTMAMWIKWDATRVGPNNWMWSARAGGNSVGIQDSGTGNILQLVVRGAATTTTVVSDTGITSDAWFLVVAWHDASGDTINIQINNGAVQSQPHTDGTAAWGSWQFGGNLFGGGLEGYMDEVGYWNRVLTSGERSALYNSGSGATYPF
jgi:hypothetical protein